MSDTLIAFLTQAIPKAADDLEAAVLRLPEDKRNWSPMGDARSALDMVAECAVANDVTHSIEKRVFEAEPFFEAIRHAKTELINDWDRLRSQMHESAARTVRAMQRFPAEELNREIAMPWGPVTLAQILSYPYWNMSYHEGQVNYIASMLGCLG
jgi:uncharacterized damage-inducible protein DinB